MQHKLPDELAAKIGGYSWQRITLGQSQSRTYRLTGEGPDMYLKIQSLTAVESLVGEKERLVWLQGTLPVPEVLFYGRDDADEYMLITEIAGINASDKCYESALPQLMQQLAYGLKAVHRVEIAGCPFDQRLDVKIKEAAGRVERQQVDEDDFDEARKGFSARELLKELQATRPAAEDIVFTHGDYCLPNIILHGGKVSGFIDWGRAGLADRYQDLALAVRSIRYNFGQEHVQAFLDAYGLAELDEDKIRYYQLLDEFF
ncbi:APH(3') family aminoglycoside O-phosphotransferase [Bacillus sp. 3255]|uniref:APH(3') family aminoglycoside O-phosphotransferase n=1 Tax=Bacillus sp. 3255 TaxID=2817904 RepID=UPI002857C5FA|nr:APH(3') family aminoglycoside O-phosphotransferase [Bacillus sp. 3255]MDR6881512.1 kanamycin kinase/aminoglycoside 3'-phosphotransferase-2 [Bacillus sp. 3255]